MFLLRCSAVYPNGIIWILLHKLITIKIPWFSSYIFALYQYGIKIIMENWWLSSRAIFFKLFILFYFNVLTLSLIPEAIFYYYFRKWKLFYFLRSLLPINCYGNVHNLVSLSDLWYLIRGRGKNFAGYVN